MWWSEAWEWRSHDLAERNPNRRTGGLRIQSCYVLVCVFTIILYIIIYIIIFILTINILPYIIKNGRINHPNIFWIKQIMK